MFTSVASLSWDEFNDGLLLIATGLRKIRRSNHWKNRLAQRAAPRFESSSKPATRLSSTWRVRFSLARTPFPVRERLVRCGYGPAFPCNPSTLLHNRYFPRAH